MRIFLVASTVFLVTGSPYGPPPNENEVFSSKTNTDCSSIDGCRSESNVQLSPTKFSSGSNRFPQEVNAKVAGGRPYWWEGQNNPFKGGCTPGTAGCSSNTPGKVLLPSSSASNKVVNSFTTSVSGNQVGSQCVCPSSFACVNWQFCQDGVMIVDGSVSIDHSKTSIPAQVSSAFGSCGKNMICCRIPTCGDVGQAPNVQTSSKFLPPKQNQNDQTSHFSKTEPQSEVDSQSTFSFGVLQSQQGSNKFSQTHATFPALGSPENQKKPHFTEISTESKKPISSPHDSIKVDDSVQSGTIHSSQKIPGIQEVPSEFAVFTQTPSSERVEPELDLDGISSYLPPSPSAFQPGQSQLPINVNHNQQDDHQQKLDTNKFNKPTLPEQGTKFTSPSVVSHGKPDQTAQISGTVHQTKQPLKPIDKDEERLPSHFSGKPDQNKNYEDDSTDSFNTNLPLTPQLTKPVKPAPGDSHVFTPQTGSGTSGHVALNFPTSPSRPSINSQSESHKLGEKQDQQSTFISGQVGPTKETKFQGSQYNPVAPAQKPDQAVNAGSFGTGHAEQVHFTFTSGQNEKTKEPKFPTSQYQPDQPTHLGSLEFQSGQHSQSNIGNLDHQAKPDQTLSIVSPVESKPTGGDTSFHSQSQQSQLPVGFGSSSFSSQTQGSQYGSGHSQGRPESTFSSESSGIHTQPSTHDFASHSQTSQQHVGGAFGSSSFESGHSQGRPVSTFSSKPSGTNDQPNAHGLVSHSQTTQQHTGDTFGSSSIGSGSQFQFGQSNTNFGAGLNQPGRPESTNAGFKPQGSGVNLHGTASSTFDRETLSTGIVTGAGTQSSGMGGMMMMMGPMLVGGKMMLNGEVMTTVSGNPLISGSCSAGQFCLPKTDCNPYNGFIILYANQQVAASFPNAPTVPLLGCHIGGISDSESFCCQLPHPLLGPDGKPFD